MREEDIERAVGLIVDSFRHGGKLLLCGNGGSAADCAHIVGELAKGFLSRRPLEAELRARIGEKWADGLQQGLPAIDLTANCALIAAITNDIDGVSAYAQQVLAYGRPGDVLLGISTSGNAENVCRALITGRALGLATMGMTGAGGGRMAGLCDLLLDVEATQTHLVQERHLPLYHRLCMDIERKMFGGERGGR